LEKIDKLCKDLSIETLLPHRDVGVYDSGDSSRFFKGDIELMNKCDFMIAVLDWKGIGSGTAFDIGYVYSLGKKVIGLVEGKDTLNITDRVCVMCLNACELVDGFDELEKEVKKIISK
jgi:nucleoside 2-deoxyribosyltransferase